MNDHQTRFIRAHDEASAALGLVQSDKRTPILRLSPLSDKLDSLARLVFLSALTVWFFYSSWSAARSAAAIGLLTTPPGRPPPAPIGLSDLDWRILAFGAVFGALVMAYAVYSALRWGLLPFFYSLAWSPQGLEARLLGRRGVFPPGSAVAVRFLPLLGLPMIRSPQGRWAPVRSSLLNKVAALDIPRPERAFTACAAPRSSPAPPDGPASLFKKTRVIGDAASVSALLGEHAVGERIPVLRIVPAKERWNVIIAMTCFAITIAFLTHWAWSRGDPGNIPLWLILVPSVAFFGIGHAACWGWFPSIYWLEWSPDGLEMNLFGRRSVLPPGGRVRVMELWPLIRSPQGRWIPIPRRVLNTVAIPQPTGRSARPDDNRPTETG